MIVLFILLCVISAGFIVASALYLGHDGNNKTSAMLLSVGLAFAVPTLCLAALLVEAPAIGQVANSPAVVADVFSASHSKPLVANDPSIGEESVNFAQAHKLEAEAGDIEANTEIKLRAWNAVGAGMTWDFLWHNFPSVLYPFVCVAVIVFILGAVFSWNITRRRSEG